MRCLSDFASAAFDMDYNRIVELGISTPFLLRLKGALQILKLTVLMSVSSTFAGRFRELWEFVDNNADAAAIFNSLWHTSSKCVPVGFFL